MLEPCSAISGAPNQATRGGDVDDHACPRYGHLASAPLRPTRKNGALTLTATRRMEEVGLARLVGHTKREDARALRQVWTFTTHDLPSPAWPARRAATSSPRSAATNGAAPFGPDGRGGLLAAARVAAGQRRVGAGPGRDIPAARPMPLLPPVIRTVDPSGRSSCNGPSSVDQVRADVRRPLEQEQPAAIAFWLTALPMAVMSPASPGGPAGYVTSSAASGAARSRRRELAGRTAQVQRTRYFLSAAPGQPSGSARGRWGGARANARPVPTAANLTSAIRDPSPGAGW